MKQGGCPKCQGREVYEVDQALLPDYDSHNAIVPLTLTTHYGPTGDVGFFGDKTGRTSVHIAAYVCAACAYTELYAKDLDVLAAFAQRGAAGVRKVKR